MAAKHGIIGEYDARSEDWESYIRRTSRAILRGERCDGPSKKRAILLSICGAETYTLIRNLVAPEKPTSRSFAQLVELVHHHYNPKPTVMVERF